MSRILGFTVGAIWLLFALLALRNAAAGWAHGHSDLGFWWAVIAAFLAIAGTAALVGTARYRYEGPKK